MSPAQLTQLHRRRQLFLRDRVLADVARVWPTLRYTDLDGSFPALLAAVGQLVASNRRMSAGLAAAYLRAYRAASGRTGDVRVVIPPLVPEQVRTALHVTSVAAVKTATGKGVLEAVAMSRALSQASGAAARLSLNGGRETIGQTIAADPQARGWVRVLGGTGCDFCRSLAGREYPASTVDFECHDRCGCGMEPSY